MQNSGTFGNARGTGFHLVSIAIGLILQYLTGCQAVTDYSNTAPATRETPTFEAATEKSVRYEIRTELSDIRFSFSGPGLWQNSGTITSFRLGIFAAKYR